MNLSIIIGRLTRDPEMRYTASGTAMAKFDLAVSRKTKDRDGNAAEATDYIPVIVWGRQAETCERFLKKGRQCCVRGRNSITSYEDKNGNKRKRYEVVADNVEFLGGRDNSSRPEETQRHEPETTTGDEIPF